MNQAVREPYVIKAEPLPFVVGVVGAEWQRQFRVELAVRRSQPTLCDRYRLLLLADLPDIPALGVNIA